MSHSTMSFTRSPRNPVYAAIHRAYVDWLRKPWSCIESTAEIDTMMYAGHEAISKAIIARDPDLAEDALRRHLNTAFSTACWLKRHSQWCLSPRPRRCFLFWRSVADALAPGMR
jgi:DNA-binding FadR family transcriptional regulator